MENTNRGMHGDSLPMLAPTGASNRKPLPLGMGYITANKTAVLYNEYVLKNSRVWDGNIPKDIMEKLPII